MKIIKDKEVFKKEQKLKDIKLKIEKYKKSRVTHSTIVKWELKFQNLNNYLNEELSKRLLIEDFDFKALAETNIRLLKNSRIVFKTSRNGMSITGSHATVLKGKVHENGHIYCQTEKTNFPIFNFLSEYSFPSAFKGNVDCLGNVHLIKSDTGMALIKTLPKEFEGTINEEGKISIITKERESELFTKGSYIISRIVSTYAFSDERTEREFFNNKEKLIEKINIYREKITATNTQ